ncbi:hypothetical protein [Turicibacter bilis]|uniref:hypothetical protein n=1 Tax=Turicibacter bilis TaxID=2735723 RepID=UPI001BAEC5E2|nr:hypothetical protein [Turicibacter bilis]MBS3199211.1 hypothetical protein [Turicibacter bilis]
MNKNILIIFLTIISLILGVNTISKLNNSKELHIEKNNLTENQIPKTINSQKIIDEVLFGLINSENNEIELPNTKPDYTIKISNKQKNIWWLEIFIWINEEQIIISSTKDIEKNKGNLYEKNTGIYHTINSIILKKEQI